MAGERIGKTYEAFLKVALDRLHASGALDGTVFWNETPAGISVEPDFSVGVDKDHPNIVIMVTHSGSSKESEKKCWRNIGELCEIKTSISPSPLALSVFFESVMKEQLKKLQGTAFDAQLIVDARPYGPALKTWVHENEADLPTDQAEKATEIERRCATDTVLREVTAKLTEDVGEMLPSATLHMNDLWQYESAREKRTAPIAQETYIRRGVSKLLMFTDLNMAIRLYRGKHVLISEVPDYLFQIGFAGKAIGKAIPTDREIQNAVSLLTDRQLSLLYDAMDDNTVINSWRDQLRNISSIEYIGQFVKEQYASLIDPNLLYDYAISLYANPLSLRASTNPPEGWNPQDVWLITYLIEIVKAFSGRSNGYGISQIALDVINSGYGTPSDASDASQFGGGFGFSAWLMRKRTAFRDDLLHGVCQVLSVRLNAIGFSKLQALIDSKGIKESMITNLIEVKLCTYRMFEPLFVLLSEKIGRLEKCKYRTCFAEKAGLSGQTGATTVAVVRNTIINWQSATIAGRDHKRKELCGRAVGLRYTWDATENTFKPRPEVQKLILLLDGTWTQKDLDALIKAGWDEIYYPDEIDKLKAAIV